MDWTPGLEFALWKAVVDGPPVEDYPVVGDAEVTALRLLAEEANGWFWMPPGENMGEQFLDAENWQEKYASWLQAHA